MSINSNIPNFSVPVLTIKGEGVLMNRDWYRFFLNPNFDSVSFTNPVGVASGGTGLKLGVSGGVLAFTNTTTLASSGVLAQFGPVLGGGAGNVPTSMSAGTDGQLIVGQTAAAPAWASVSGDATLAKTGALTVANGAITYAKIQNVSATGVFLGRKTAGAGPVEEITPAGDVTLSGSTLTVAANAISNAKLAQMAANSVKLNNTGAPANAIDGTVAQAQALLAIPPQTGPSAWTPADGSGAGLSFSAVSANFTQVGNMVFAYATLTYPVTVDGSAAKISGLPVGVANANYAQVPAIVTTTVTISGGLVIVAIKATTTAKFDVGSPFGVVTNAQLSTGTVTFMLIYPAA